VWITFALALVATTLVADSRGGAAFADVEHRSTADGRLDRPVGKVDGNTERCIKRLHEVRLPTLLLAFKSS
jgi:hypothetical protein